MLIFDFPLQDTKTSSVGEYELQDKTAIHQSCILHTEEYSVNLLIILPCINLIFGFTSLVL